MLTWDLLFQNTNACRQSDLSLEDFQLQLDDLLSEENCEFLKFACNRVVHHAPPPSLRLRKKAGSAGDDSCVCIEPLSNLVTDEIAYLLGPDIDFVEGRKLQQRIKQGAVCSTCQRPLHAAGRFLKLSQGVIACLPQTDAKIKEARRAADAKSAEKKAMPAAIVATYPVPVIPLPAPVPSPAAKPALTRLDLLDESEDLAPAKPVAEAKKARKQSAKSDDVCNPSLRSFHFFHRPRTSTS